MKPSDNERFMPRQVEAIIKEIMDKKLKKAKFDDQKCKVSDEYKRADERSQAESRL